MAKIYSNENFPQPVVEALRQHGHDVLTTLENGKAGQRIPDDEVLAFAAKSERVLVTLNRKHFVRLHTEKPDHAGIIVCTVDADFAALANRVHEALALNADMKGGRFESTALNSKVSLLRWGFALVGAAWEQQSLEQWVGQSARKSAAVW